MAAEEGRGVEYALSDLAECIRLLIGRVREDSSHADQAARLKVLREAVHLNFGAAGGEYVLPSQQACCETERASLITAPHGLTRERRCGLRWSSRLCTRQRALAGPSSTCSSRPSEPSTPEPCPIPKLHRLRQHPPRPCSRRVRQDPV